MFERFDEQARNVIVVAGNIAARRERERTGEATPRKVRVQVRDVREALALLAPKGGWQGGFNGPLGQRFNMLRERRPRGTITVDDLREMVR